MMTIIGVLGLVFVLTAFLGRNLKKFSPKSLWFNGLTFLGSISLVIYSYFTAAWVFFVLNMVFGFISLYYVYKGFVK